MERKIRFLIPIFILAFAGLIAKLFYWQVIKASDLSLQARKQYDSSQVTLAPRGNILASDGSYWAVRVDSWRVVADSEKLKDSPAKIANKLAPFFVDDPDSKTDLLTEAERLTTLLSKKASYIPLKQRIGSETKKNIEAMNLESIRFEGTESRYYPEASSAAQLLGFLGKDENGNDIGYFGLEGYYDLALSGKPGFVGREKGANGNPILLNGSQQVSAISGVSLITNIDKRVQLLAEEKLKEGIEKYSAIGGSVTVMDPYTGRVLAIASSPSFEPGKYWEYGDSFFKNPVISDSFEPGSIFKVLVMGAGLDAGVVKPDTPCDICAEPLKVDRFFIKTWNNEYHPNINMTDVIIHSDNVGMSFVGQKLGADKMYDYMDKFGIGKQTGIDLQGEVSPAMRKKGTWNVVDLATASFGQGIAVTGIQMMRAVSAIANGGYLVEPRVVDKIQRDGWEEEVKRDTPKRIISTEASGEVTQMMIDAAENGEAKWTRIPGFSVAGKTGTAQIPVSGHYDEDNTIHSFIGFAPARKPKFIMLVTLKSPQSSLWAAETAAPVWYSIAKDLFPYLGVQPE